MNTGTKIRNDIERLLTKYGFELVSFQYFRKVFGNIVVLVKCNNRTLTFVTDRGEIYLDGNPLCSYDYLLTERKSTPEKLLELMEAEFSRL